VSAKKAGNEAFCSRRRPREKTVANVLPLQPPKKHFPRTPALTFSFTRCIFRWNNILALLTMQATMQATIKAFAGAQKTPDESRAVSAENSTITHASKHEYQKTPVQPIAGSRQGPRGEGEASRHRLFWGALCLTTQFLQKGSISKITWLLERALQLDGVGYRRCFGCLRDQKGSNSSNQDKSNNSTNNTAEECTIDTTTTLVRSISSAGISRRRSRARRRRFRGFQRRNSCNRNYLWRTLWGI
jgi:hypothetical protein